MTEAHFFCCEMRCRPEDRGSSQRGLSVLILLQVPTNSLS